MVRDKGEFTEGCVLVPDRVRCTCLKGDSGVFPLPGVRGFERGASEGESSELMSMVQAKTRIVDPTLGLLLIGILFCANSNILFSSVDPAAIISSTEEITVLAFGFGISRVKPRGGTACARRSWWATRDKGKMSQGLTVARGGAREKSTCKQM